MTTAYSWCTLWSVSLYQGLQFSILFLSPLKITAVCILAQYPDEWISIGQFRYRPLPYCSSLCNLYHLVPHFLLNFIVFCPDSMHQTLHSWIQCICAIFFNLVLQAHRKTSRLSDITTHCVNELRVLQWLQASIQFARSSQFASPHCC